MRPVRKLGRRGKTALVVAITGVSATFILPGLGLGSSPVSILCANKSGSRYVEKQHPSKCAVFGPHGSFGGGVNLASLRWTGWGGATARARGIEQGFHLPPEHIPVRVVVTGRRSGRCGPVYTRMTATSRNGTTRVRLKTCPGRTF